MDFKNTTNLVKDILIKNPLTRDSDPHLYIEVMMRLNPNATKMPFAMVLRNLTDLGLPLYDTVTRARRKVQAEYPELQGTERVKKFRAELEEEYKEYSRS